MTCFNINNCILILMKEPIHYCDLFSQATLNGTRFTCLKHHTRSMCGFTHRFSEAPEEEVHIIILVADSTADIVVYNWKLRMPLEYPMEQFSIQYLGQPLVTRVYHLLDCKIFLSVKYNTIVKYAKQQSY